MSKIALFILAFITGISVCAFIFLPQLFRNSDTPDEFEIRLQEYKLQEWKIYFEYCQDIFEYEKYDLENIRMYQEKLDECMYKKTKQGLYEF